MRASKWHGGFFDKTAKQDFNKKNKTLVWNKILFWITLTFEVRKCILVCWLFVRFSKSELICLRILSSSVSLLQFLNWVTLSSKPNSKIFFSFNFTTVIAVLKSNTSPWRKKRSHILLWIFKLNLNIYKRYVFCYSF